jgi:hypothetical protein
MVKPPRHRSHLLKKILCEFPSLREIIPPSFDKSAGTNRMELELLRAYLETTYLVRFLDGDLPVRVGEVVHDPRLSELESWGIITAYNPGSRQESAERNAAANDELAAELSRRGLHWIPGDGIPADDSWPVEPGFCVLNVRRETIRKLCRQFGQNGAVFSRRGETPAILLRDGREVRSIEEST